MAKNPLYTCLKVVGCAIVALIIVEHIAHTQQSNVKPSVALNCVATQFQRFFQWIGEVVALFSSFLTIINLRDLGVSIDAICTPILCIIFSPFYTIYGYLTMANSYSNNWLVYIGSGLLVIAVIYGWYRFWQQNQRLVGRKPQKRVAAERQ